MTFEAENVSVVPTTPDSTTIIAVAVVVAVIILVIFLLVLAYYYIMPLLRRKNGDQSNTPWYENGHLSQNSEQNSLTEEMVPVTLERARRYVAFNSLGTLGPEYQVSDEVRRGGTESDKSASLRGDQSQTFFSSEAQSLTPLSSEVLRHSPRPTSSAESSSTATHCSHDPSPPSSPPTLPSNGRRFLPPSLGLTVGCLTSNEFQTGSSRPQTPSPIATNPYARSPYKEKPKPETPTGNSFINKVFPGVDKLSHGHDQALEKSIESFVSQWDSSSSSPRHGPLPLVSDSCSRSDSRSNLALHKVTVSHQTPDPSKSDILTKSHSSPRNLAPQDIVAKTVKTTKNDSISEDERSKSLHDGEALPNPNYIHCFQTDLNCTPSDAKSFDQCSSSGLGPTFLTPDARSHKEVQQFTLDYSSEVDPLDLSQDQHFTPDLVDKKTCESSIHSQNQQDSFDSRVVDSSGSMAWDSSCDILTVSIREPSVHPSFHQDGQFTGKMENQSFFATPKEDAGQNLLTQFSSRNRSFSSATREPSVLSGRSDVYITCDEM